jgi:hypothetical protein
MVLNIIYIKNWIETLAIEAETAISQWDLPKQNYYRNAVTINQNKLIKNQNSNKNIKNIQERKIINRTKQKLNDNSLMIPKADKGKTLVILPMETYKTKYTILYRTTNLLI